MRKRHIKTRSFPRVGLVGNPSDGYFGRTIAFTFKNFSSEILLGEDSTRISFVNRESEFDSVEDLCDNIQLHGYYGGIRLLKAAIKRFRDHCRENGIQVDLDKKFKITYSSNIPQQVGLAGSSAILTATFRALMDFYEVEIENQILPNLIQEVETHELKIPAGLQDRVVQVYDNLVFMDFDKKRMESDGYGRYEKLDPGLLPNVYVAYRSSMSEGTEVFHNNIRARYQSGETVVVEAMQAWAEMAEQGRKALVDGDMERLTCLINANFDLRSRIYRISPGNEEMIRVARQAGATAKFAGSGGAIVGTYNDDNHLQALTAELAEIGVVVIKPVVR